jgi:hypothetical protein
LAQDAHPQWHCKFLGWRGIWDGAETRDFSLTEYEVDALRSAVDKDLMTVRSKRYRMSMELK